VNRLVKDSEISLKDAEESLNKKIMFSIPNAYKITMNAINQGKPISAVAQGTEIWKKYRELTYLFSGNGEKEKVSKKRKGGYPLSSFFKHT
jgi:pilus assembly protein CpaE